MNIFFIGYLVPWDLCYKLKAASVAGNKMQINIVKNLKENNTKVKIYTILPVAQFPKSKNIFVSANKLKLDKKEITYIPFINIPIIKQLSIMINLFVILFRDILREKDKPVFLSYNNFSPVSLPLLGLKKTFGLKNFCIVADLPHTLYKFNRTLKKYLERLDFKFQISSLKKYSGLFPVTEYVSVDYASMTPFLTIEGGINLEDFVDIIHGNEVNRSDNIKTIMYSGYLDDINGITLLLEAFKEVKASNIRLAIFGKGPLEEYVLKEAKNNKKIQFMGFHKNSVILEYQSKCDFLIIPRPINQDINRYTFPSKLFEYMMAEKPIICTDIECLTDEYRELLFISKDDTINGFSDFINMVIKLDKSMIDEKAMKCKDFLVNNKTWKVQAKKMKEFMMKYMK